MDYSTIGQQIRKRREELGLTQEKLAERCSLSLSYMGAVERSNKIPSLETFIRIANALEVSSDRLLSGVLLVGNHIIASELYESMADLSSDTQRRILNVVRTMVADSKS